VSRSRLREDGGPKTEDEGSGNICFIIYKAKTIHWLRLKSAFASTGDGLRQRVYP
jgi:hypothetical protein